MKLFLYSYNRLNPYSQLYCMYGMLVYTNSIRHHCMIRSLRSLPRIGYTPSHSSRRNIWTSSRSSRTCSERWPAPKPPFGSGSYRHSRSGTWKNSHSNRTGNRKNSCCRSGSDSCRHNRSGTWKNSRPNRTGSRKNSCCHSGSGSCRRKRSGILTNSRRNSFHSRKASIRRYG